MTYRPRIYLLKLTDPERAIDDPGLAALARDGWTVASATHVVRFAAGGEERELMLILWPPSGTPRPGWLFVAGCVAAGVVGQLAALAVAALAL